MGRTVIRTHLILPIALALATAMCAVAAALLDRPAWAAALGAGLMLLYWGLEVLAWRRGEASSSFGGAMGVALSGMVVRLLLVIGVLAVVGLFAQPAFATAAVSFLVVFTLYLPLRLLGYNGMSNQTRHAGAR
jgi:hypothetical protein